MKLRKNLSAILAAVMIAVSIPISVGASTEYFNGGDYKYSVVDGKAVVHDLRNDLRGDVVIPDTLGGYPVAAVGYGAFGESFDITSVVVPDGTTVIDGSAFYMCTSLRSVTIPDSVRVIGANAFNFCSSLESVTIPYGVTRIGEGTFYTCEALNDITVPNSVTAIGKRAFLGCDELRSITLSENLTSIGEEAFFYCTSLVEITISDSVTEIGARAFEGCEALERVVISAGVTSIADNAFAGCNNLEICCYKDSAAYTYAVENDIPFELIHEHPVEWFKGKANSCLESGYASYVKCTECDYTTYSELPKLSEEGSHTVPDEWSIEVIPGEYSYGLLTKPCTVCGEIMQSREVYPTTMEFGTKYYNDDLGNYISYSLYKNEATITDGRYDFVGLVVPYRLGGSPVTSIGDGALAGKTYLTSLLIPEGLSITIGDNACTESFRIEQIVINESVKSIGKEAFVGCRGLKKLYLPNTSEMEVSPDAFGGYYNHTPEVYFPGTEEEWQSSVWSEFSLFDESTIHYSHEHNFVQMDNIEATCTNAGAENYKYCKECSYTSFKQIPKTNHIPGEWVIEAEPTMDNEGLRVKYCTICEAELQREVMPKLEYITGDANGDNNVNISDATAILKSIAKWDITIDKTAADVNKDGTVNISDVTLILKYIAG